MVVYVGKDLEIYNPNDDVIFWAKQNLIVPNPDYAKKLRMGLWLGKTPQNIRLYSTLGDLLILPFGCLKHIMPLLGECDEVLPTFEEPFEVDYGKGVSLYDYQEKAVEAMLTAKYGILQAPAGSGKTQMGIAMITKLGKRALWLTHTKDLLNQSLNRAKQYIDPSLLGTITEGKVNIGNGITFATVQTMSHIDLQRLEDHWDVIVVDECHRVAGSPTALTQFYKVISNLSARHKYGLSATVHRADGLIKTTFAILGDIEYSVPEEATKDRVMKVTVQPISTGIELGHECFDFDGTIKYANTISYLAENPERNTLIRNYILMNHGHSMLILSARLNQLQMLRNSLPDELYADSAMIDGKMQSKKGKAEREQAIEDMRNGKIHILFATYGLAKEGLDIPRLDRLLLATPEKDYAVITQSIGRIARVFNGKDTPMAYDFVDAAGLTAGMYRKRLATYKKNNCEVKPFG